MLACNPILERAGKRPPHGTKFNYDGLQRLTSIGRNNGRVQDCTLDALGNKRQVSTSSAADFSSVTSTNQFTEANNSRLTHVANGNIIVDEQGPTLVYDAWNCLVGIKDAALSVTIAYDGLSRRTQETVVGNPDEHLFFTSDSNYSVISIIPSAGMVLQHQVYSSYGEVTFTGQDCISTANNAYAYDEQCLFQDMHYDVTIGWYVIPTRHYHASLPYWNQVDPAHADSLDWFILIAANPINYTDPSGTEVFVIERQLDFPWTAVVAAATIAAGQTGAAIGAKVTHNWMGAAVGEIAGDIWGHQVSSFYEQNTWHCAIVVSNKCDANIDKKGNVTGFSVAPADTFDFQADRDKVTGKYGRVYNPARDFAAASFPSKLYGRYKVVQITFNAASNAAVIAAAKALDPAPHEYRIGGNVNRYNCCDWAHDVLARAGLAFANPNPMPFGSAPAPAWVLAPLLGAGLDKLPAPL